MQPWLSDDGTRDIEALINDYIAIHTAAIASDDSAVIVGCQTLMTDASPVQNDPPIPVPAFAARYATVVSNYLGQLTLSGVKKLDPRGAPERCQRGPT
jgi:hypothetical protein